MNWWLPGPLAVLAWKNKGFLLTLQRPPIVVLRRNPFALLNHLGYLWARLNENKHEREVFFVLKIPINFGRYTLRVVCDQLTQSFEHPLD